MNDIPLQYSNEPADRTFIRETTDTGATLLFPPRPHRLFSVVNGLYEPVLLGLCLACVIWIDVSLRRGGAWPAWLFFLAFVVGRAMLRAFASQPNTVRISDGWIKVDSAISQTLRRKRFWLEPLLRVRLDSALSKVKEVSVEATRFHYRGYLLGKIVIRTDGGRVIAVGSGRPLRELEQAAKLLCRAMYNARWRPPRTMLMKMGRLLGSALHPFIPT